MTGVQTCALPISTININQKQVDIEQQNNYPWNGDLKFVVSPKKGIVPFALKVRIPGWVLEEAIPSDLYTFGSKANNKVVIKVNGVAVDYKTENGYAIIDKSWNKNDVVEVNLPLDVRRVYSDKLTDDIGKVAIQRGPLMYCAEWADNDGKVTNIILPSSSAFTSEFNPNLLNGVTTLKANIQKVEIANNQVSTVQRQLIAIPYYAWANRGTGEMTVWFNEQLKDIDVITKK